MRFSGIFALLAFFLVTRAVFVFPYVQNELQSTLMPATLFMCDSLSIVVLLYRVPKGK